VLAVVGAGRPDGDAHARFGFLLGFDDHRAAAEELGLAQSPSEPVADDAPDTVLTDAGRVFVQQFRLTELPDGRANYWNVHHAALIEPATAELARRHSTLHSQRPAH
jgi:hypothetical protein